jgi:hypothetical protein
MSSPQRSIGLPDLQHRRRDVRLWVVRTYYLFTLDLNGNAVVIGGARNDH